MRKLMQDGSAYSNLDVIENTVCRHFDLLEILLIDRTRTTKQRTHNILWATSSYAKHSPTQEIQLADITGKNTFSIQPRIAKSKAEQKIRTRDKAEVFTPRSTVHQMNQSIDWKLGHWPATNDNWHDYIQEKRIEITCGEGPFIVGRYNALSGKKVLKLDTRAGFLDRKLQVVSMFCDTQETWLEWAKVAFKCSYGYEWQGDSLLIARENLLYTFVDYFNDKFPESRVDLDNKLSADAHRMLTEIAEIISWNIFQMDGLKYVIPMSCKHTEEIVSEAPGLLKMLGEKDIVRKKFCEGCLKSDPKLHNGKKVKIMDWDTNSPVYFYRLLQ